MTLKLKIVSLLAGVVILAVGVGIFSLRTPIDTISINGTELTVRVARNALAHKRGLSGYTEETLHADGMLFLFSQSKVRTFWMKGMDMDLDILWISEGIIVAIDRNVPAPLSRSAQPATVTSNPLAVDKVLELPAGKVAEYGIIEGMQVIY